MANRLFVFDEAVPARAELCGMLERAGFVVLAGAVQDDVDRILDVYQPDALVARLAADPAAAMAICRYQHRAPVVLMAAPDVPAESRAAARRSGADGVLIEPIDPAELLACLETLLAHRGAGQSLEVGDITIAVDQHLVSRAGHDIQLTGTEFRLLVVLAANPDRVLSKAQLLQRAWGYDDYDANLVEVHISALRRKLEAYGPRAIQTVREFGYVLRSQPPRLVAIRQAAGA